MAPVISIMMAEKLVFAIARRHTTCLPDLVRCRGQSAPEQNRYRFLPMLWPTVSTHCRQHRQSAGGMARDAIFSAEVAAPPWPVSGHPGASAQLLLERGAGVAITHGLFLLASSPSNWATYGRLMPLTYDLLTSR
jgi:hypothetical protein